MLSPSFFYIFVLYMLIFLVPTFSINIITNKVNKQHVLSPSSLPASPISKYSNTDDEALNDRLDKIYEDGVKKVADFELVKKPVVNQQNQHRFDARVLVKPGTANFIYAEKKKTTVGEKANDNRFMFQQINKKKAKIVKGIWVWDTGMDTQSIIKDQEEKFKNMVEMNSEIDVESTSEVVAYKKMNPHKVKREVKNEATHFQKGEIH